MLNEGPPERSPGRCCVRKTERTTSRIPRCVSSSGGTRISPGAILVSPPEPRHCGTISGRGRPRRQANQRSPAARSCSSRRFPLDASSAISLCAVLRSGRFGRDPGLCRGACPAASRLLAAAEVPVRERGVLDARLRSPPTLLARHEHHHRSEPVIADRSQTVAIRGFGIRSATAVSRANSIGLQTGSRD